MKHVMDRKAADNKYLHRDFHVTADVGLAYVGEHYGDNGIAECLGTFAKRYYSPLIAKIKEEGLRPLAEHITNIYQIEEADDALTLSLTDDELAVEVSYCPAVRHMKKSGHEPSKWYVCMTSEVNKTIADEADIGFEMISYDPENGAAKYRFFKRSF